MSDAPSGYLPSEPWFLDKLSLTPDGEATRVEISGWAFPGPELAMPMPGRFLLNGTPFPEIHYPVHRPDIAKVFWQRPNAEYSGFQCTASVPTSRLYPGGALEFSFINPGPVRRIAAQQSWFKCDPERELPLPDETRRFRVIGTNSIDDFTRGGFTDFKRLEAAAVFFNQKRRLFPRGRILDFGCGCGRVARYTSQMPFVKLTGIDIDSGNVAWCAANLKGTFVPTSLRPPIPFPANSFDLLYGVSVFTHMRETMQDAWLAELHRVSAPGALLLMTIHGRTALDYAAQTQDAYREIECRISKEGLFVSGSNTQLDTAADHEGEYVNVFHDLNYVRKR